MTESPDQYAENVAADTEPLLRDADAEVSALTGGAANQTVSARVAAAAERREWWAVAFCGVLSVCVQRDHCAAMASPAPSPWFVYPRALFCFLSVPFVLWALCDWRPALLGAWACAMAANIVGGMLL